jgi:hypothetical protein
MNAAVPEHLPISFGRIRFVTHRPIRRRTRSTTAKPRHPQTPQNFGEHRRITALARSQQNHQRPKIRVTQRVNLRRQATA